MFKTATFNIYEENLDTVVFGEKKSHGKKPESEDSTDKPIPKPPPPYWNDPLSYRRFNGEREGTNKIL